LASTENVDVVDEEDQVLYPTTLEDCKRRGLLHRTACVFLRNSKNELLLQKRSLSDDWLPGKWTVSCTGHIRSGEDAFDGSVRELQEELGITTRPEFVFKQKLPRITWNGFIEHEIAYVFLAVSDTEISFDKNEVAEVVFLSDSACVELIKSKQTDFTPDALILIQKYLQEAETK
jgi:isopentenyl-diphosphate Delta-isomerase